MINLNLQFYFDIMFNSYVKLLQYGTIGMDLLRSQYCKYKMVYGLPLGNMHFVRKHQDKDLDTLSLYRPDLMYNQHSVYIRDDNLHTDYQYNHQCIDKSRYYFVGGKSHSNHMDLVSKGLLVREIQLVGERTVKMDHPYIRPSRYTSLCG